MSLNQSKGLQLKKGRNLNRRSLSYQMNSTEEDFHFGGEPEIISSGSEEPSDNAEDISDRPENSVANNTQATGESRKLGEKLGTAFNVASNLLSSTAESVKGLVEKGLETFGDDHADSHEYYRVIGEHGITVRSTSKLDSKLLGTLAKSTIVHVVQRQGRRFKIDRPQRGWISLCASSGKLRFLEPCEPPKEDKSNQIDELKTQIESLRQANSSLDYILALKDKKIASVEQELNELETGKMDILELVEAIRAISAEMSREETMCKQEWALHDQLTGTCKKYDNMIAMQARKIKTIDEEVKECKQQLLFNSQDHELKMSVRQEKTGELEDAEEVMFKIQASMEEQKRIIGELSEELQKLNQETSIVQAEVSKYESEYIEAKKVIDKQNTQYDDITSDMERLKAERAALEAKIKEDADEV